MIAEDSARSGETLHARHTILLKEIFMNRACSSARVFWTPEDVSRHGTDGITPCYSNTAIGSTRLSSPVNIGCSTTSFPSRTWSQDIISPREYIGPSCIRDSQPLDTFINGVYSEHRDTAPTWSKEICRKFTNKSRADVNSLCRMNLTRDAVRTESLKRFESGSLFYP